MRRISWSVPCFRVVFWSVPVRSVPENRDALYGIVYVTLQVKIKTEPAGYGAQKYVSLYTRFHLNVVILISFSLLKELQHRQMENVLVDSISDILLLCVSLHSIRSNHCRCERERNTVVDLISLQVERMFHHYIQYCTNLPNQLRELEDSMYGCLSNMKVYNVCKLYQCVTVFLSPAFPHARFLGS